MQEHTRVCEKLFDWARAGPPENASRQNIPIRIIQFYPMRKGNFLVSS